MMMTMINTLCLKITSPTFSIVTWRRIISYQLSSRRVTWETERSFDGQLRQEYYYQKLLKSDNPFSNYTRQCGRCFSRHGVKLTNRALLRINWFYSCIKWWVKVITGFILWNGVCRKLSWYWYCYHIFTTSNSIKSIKSWPSEISNLAVV